MRTGPNGEALIKAFESCLKPVGGGRFTTYYCPANVLTIGWGTTRSDVPTLKPGQIWTQAECDAVFAKSLGKYEAAVLKALPGISLTQGQFDALVSMAYNCGPKFLSGSVGRAIREGRHGDVPKLMMQWVRGGGRVLPGLVRRREAEGLLYQGRINDAMRKAGATMPGTMPQNRNQTSVIVPKDGATIGGSAAGAAVAAQQAGLSPWQIAAVFALVLVVGVALVVWRRRK